VVVAAAGRAVVAAADVATDRLSMTSRPAPMERGAMFVLFVAGDQMPWSSPASANVWVH